MADVVKEMRSLTKIHAPEDYPDCFIAEGAKVVGNVTMGEDSSVWFNTVIRGDIEPITMGKRVNVQDGCIFHVGPPPLIIGDDVTFGHGAIVHACTIEDCVLIGMGAIILSGCHIKKGSVIGAGAVVKENAIIEENSLMVGVPARLAKTLPDTIVEQNRHHAQEYVKLAKSHKAMQASEVFDR